MKAWPPVSVLLLCVLLRDYSHQSQIHAKSKSEKECEFSHENAQILVQEICKCSEITLHTANISLHIQTHAPSHTGHLFTSYPSFPRVSAQAEAQM